MTLRRQILEQPTKSREEHSTSNSHSRTKAVTGDLAVPSTPPARQREDYPDVPFWTKGEWDKLVERQKLANKTPSWNAFLTDEDGHALSKQRYNEIWADAKLAFNSLYFRRVDPTSWSKKTDIAAAYFYNTMTAKYPEFQFCEGNWKVQHWATERYPDWVKNVRKLGGLKCTLFCDSVSSIRFIGIRCCSIRRHGWAKASSTALATCYKSLKETPHHQ